MSEAEPTRELAPVQPSHVDEVPEHDPLEIQGSEKLLKAQFCVRIASESLLPAPRASDNFVASCRQGLGKVTPDESLSALSRPHGKREQRDGDGKQRERAQGKRPMYADQGAGHADRNAAEGAQSVV